MQSPTSQELKIKQLREIREEDLKVIQQLIAEKKQLEARIADLESQLPEPPTTPGRPIVEEMADHFRENPGCTEEDLGNAGFSARHRERFAEAARDKASRDSVRRIAA